MARMAAVTAESRSDNKTVQEARLNVSGMDANKRLQLIAKIKQQSLPGVQPALPLITLQDFFDGNDDDSSIGCNLLEYPGLQAFFVILSGIRSQPEVQDV